MAKDIDKSFNLEKNVIYYPDPKAIVETFKSLKPKSAFIIDEAITILHKYRWFDKLQQTIINMYATERYKNILSIFCIPRFTDLTENFRNHRIKVWIHIRTRGVAVVRVRDDNPDTQDAWRLKENYRLKEKFFKGRSIVFRELEQDLKFERDNVKNYLCTLKFTDLNPVDREEYLSLKYASRKQAFGTESLQDIESKRVLGLQRENALLLGKLKEKYGETNDQIAYDLEYTNPFTITHKLTRYRRNANLSNKKKKIEIVKEQYTQVYTGSPNSSVESKESFHNKIIIPNDIILD